MTTDGYVDVLRRNLSRTQLFAYDFPRGPVTVKFNDCSFLRFYDAFYILEKEEIHIFTEHFGYYSYPLTMINEWTGPDKPHPQRKK